MKSKLPLQSNARRRLTSQSTARGAVELRKVGAMESGANHHQDSRAVMQYHLQYQVNFFPAGEDASQRRANSHPSASASAAGGAHAQRPGPLTRQGAPSFQADPQPPSWPGLPPGLPFFRPFHATFPTPSRAESLASGAALPALGSGQPAANFLLACECKHREPLI